MRKEAKNSSTLKSKEKRTKLKMINKCYFINSRKLEAYIKQLNKLQKILSHGQSF